MDESISYKDLQKPFVAKMLTTEDNPFDPFEQFDDWYQFDKEKGYNTCELLARLLPNNRSFDSLNDNEIINETIDRFIRNDPLNQYVIVVKKIIPEFLTTKKLTNV